MILGFSHNYLIGDVICHDLRSSESFVGADYPPWRVIPPIYRLSIRQNAKRDQAQHKPLRYCVKCQVYALGWAACGRKKGLDEHTYDV